MSESIALPINMRHLVYLRELNDGSLLFKTIEDIHILFTAVESTYMQEHKTNVYVTFNAYYADTFGLINTHLNILQSHSMTIIELTEFFYMAKKADQFLDYLERIGYEIPLNVNF